MATVITAKSYQLQLLEDALLDAARLDRLDWQRAKERNLHALQDYVHSDHMIVYQPGTLKPDRGDAGYRAFDVQVTSTTSCTCSRFKLRDRCEHIAFVKQLEAAGMEPDMSTPVAARKVK